MHGDVDYDRAWLKLKAHIGTKRSHGQAGLFAEMALIEVECASEVEAPASAGASPHKGPLPDEADVRPSPDMSGNGNPLGNPVGGTNGSKYHKGNVV